MNIAQFDFNLLKVLYALLQTGSTRDAALKLGISSSAVSHALSRLRVALNDPLFKRENNCQVPTPFALALKTRLVPLFISLNDDLFKDNNEEVKEFKIVIPPALTGVVTSTLASLSSQLNFSVICIPFQRRSWREEVLDGSVDLVLAVGDYQNPVSSLRFDDVGCARLVVIYGEPLRANFEGMDKISLEQLVAYQHVYCLPWGQDENEIDRQLRRRGLNRSIGFKCNDYSQVIPAITTAPYIAIVPKPWLDVLQEKSRVYELQLNDELAIGKLFLMHRKSLSPWKKKTISSVKLKLKSFYI
ncbi:LysR family transcriptional regulator [Proteus hauseri]|uniref:LysR family transcriptional regulator n=1 Tax=Proteus hauseri TaxID=183417 RepID=UPI0032DB3DC8